MQIASQASACLANLAEMPENQEIIAREGGIRPCISVMRSRYVEVQRESGRLLATPGLFIKEWREDPLSTLDMDTNCRSSSLGVWSCGLAICQKGLGEVLGMGLF